MIKRFIHLLKDSPASFEGQETGEEVVLLLRRHRITVLLSLSGFVGASLIPAIIFTVFTSMIVKSGFLSLAIFIASIWYMLVWLAAFRFLTMYSLNTLIITDRRIIDRDQCGFFDQKVSELSATKIQDVTAHTKGVLETLFHFGNLVIQTAASDREFVFHKIPEPEKVKDIIMRIIASHKPDSTTV